MHSATLLLCIILLILSNVHAATYHPEDGENEDGAFLDEHGRRDQSLKSSLSPVHRGHKQTSHDSVLSSPFKGWSGHSQYTTPPAYRPNTHGADGAPPRKARSKPSIMGDKSLPGSEDHSSKVVRRLFPAPPRDTIPYKESDMDHNDEGFSGSPIEMLVPAIKRESRQLFNGLFNPSTDSLGELDPIHPTFPDGSSDQVSEKYYDETSTTELEDEEKVSDKSGPWFFLKPIANTIVAFHRCITVYDLFLTAMTHLYEARVVFFISLVYHCRTRQVMELFPSLPSLNRLLSPFVVISQVSAFLFSASSMIQKLIMGYFSFSSPYLFVSTSALLGFGLCGSYRSIFICEKLLLFVSLAMRFYRYLVPIKFPCPC